MYSRNDNTCKILLVYTIVYIIILLYIYILNLSGQANGSNPSYHLGDGPSYHLSRRLKLWVIYNHSKKQYKLNDDTRDKKHVTKYQDKNPCLFVMGTEPAHWLTVLGQNPMFICNGY